MRQILAVFVKNLWLAFCILISLEFLYGTTDLRSLVNQHIMIVLHFALIDVIGLVDHLNHITHGDLLVWFFV